MAKQATTQVNENPFGERETIEMGQFVKNPRWTPKETDQPKALFFKIKAVEKVTPKDGGATFEILKAENVCTPNLQPFSKGLDVQLYPKIATMLKNEKFGTGSYIGIHWKGIIPHPKEKHKTINDINLVFPTEAEIKHFEALEYPILDENFEANDDLPF